MHALHFSASDKAALYREVLPQIESVVADETDWVANLANTAAVLKEAFGWFWVGFYLVDTRTDELVFGAVSGAFGVYADSVRARGVRSGLGEGRDDGRRGCERASRPYCLLVFVAFGNCGSAVFRRPLYRCIGRGQRTSGSV